MDSKGCDIKIDIGLVGNSNVGKTRLIKKYKFGDSFPESADTVSTIGIDSQTVKLKVDNLVTRVTIWDPAGQERFESLAKNYFQKLDGIIMVFDLTSQNSYENLAKWHKQMKDTVDVPLIIVGNKLDLAGCCIDKDRIEDLEDLYKTKAWFTSAMTGEGVELSFNSVIESAVHYKVAKEISMVAGERFQSRVTLTSFLGTADKDKAQPPIKKKCC